MKKILFSLILGSLFIAGSLYGAVYDIYGFQNITTNIDTIIGQTPTNKVLHGSDGLTSSNKTWFISEIEVYLTGVAPYRGISTVKLYDYAGHLADTSMSPVGGITNYWSNAPYASFTVYNTNYTFLYTNAYGVTSTVVYPGVYTLSNWNAAGSQEAEKFFEQVLPYSTAAQSFKYTNLSLITTRGVMANVSSNVYITLKYKQLFP